MGTARNLLRFSSKYATPKKPIEYWLTSKKRFEIRKQRIKSKIQRVSDRYRLIINKSNKHISGQVVDRFGSVIAHASTVEKDIYVPKKNMCNKLFAAKIAEVVSSRALESGVREVVFDRAGYMYHGVVAVFADVARKNEEAA